MADSKNKTLNCTGEDADNELCKVMDEKLIKQFKIMIVVVFIVLLLFLGLFIYNLIKCYLPKWKKNKMIEEVRQVEIQNSQIK
jgi:hypothetical protein